MNEHLLNNPAKLKEFLKKTKLLKKTTSVDTIQEAISEAFFRLGVHPETPSREAFHYLYQAFKIDGTNPRHAYHLGRLYFLHDEMGEAEYWLNLAAHLCPTSHRIWAHINLLQRELNIRYKGNDQYEQDVLKKRGEQITETIKKGQDDFTSDLLDFKPPRSRAALEAEARKEVRSIDQDLNLSKEKKHKLDSLLVERIQDKGVCRWTGIHDLHVEVDFQDEASVRLRDRLYSQLDQILNLIQKRKQGMSAFVILAIEWLFTGYPVATIRRLWSQLPQQEDLALEFLDFVCSLYEVQDKELPHLLTKALETNRIPPLLAALIHNQRMLWCPLEFKQISSYRIARKFLVDYKNKMQVEDTNLQFQEQIIEYKQEMEKFLKTLLHPSLLKQIEDAPPKSPQAFDPELQEKPINADTLKQTLHDLEEASEKLKITSVQAFEFLKGQLEPRIKLIRDDENYSQAKVDRDAYSKLLILLEKAGTIGITRVEQLLKQIEYLGLNVLGEDFSKRREFVENIFKEIKTTGNFIKVLKRLDTQIEKESPNFKVLQKSASSEILTFIQIMNSFLAESQHTEKTEQGAWSYDTAEQVLQQLEQASRDLKNISTQAFDFLKGQLEPRFKQICNDENYSQAQVDREAYTVLLFNLEIAGSIGISKIEQLLKQIEHLGGNLLGEDFGQRREIVENIFKEIKTAGTFIRVLKRLDTHLEKVNSNFKVIPKSASSEITMFIQSIHVIFPEVLSQQQKKPEEIFQSPPIIHTSQSIAQTNDEKYPEKDKKQTNKTALDALETMLANVDEAIEDVFNSINANFNAYSPQIKRLSPIQKLFTMVRAREAEIFYRMGCHSKAKQLWNTILQDDRLNLAVLKNIAVCATQDSDISHSFSGWRAYCEMLYLHAVIMGDPRYQAKERAEFHHNFACAFAPAIFTTTLDSQWQNNIYKNPAAKNALISFLESPARLRIYIEHTLLEIFNKKLDFNSPTLILGVKRTEKEKIRSKAKSRLEIFTDEICNLLPERAISPFSLICRQHLMKAFEACQKTEGLTLKSDPHYDKELAVQLHWIVDIMHLLYKFWLLFNPTEELIEAGEVQKELLKAATTFEFLEQLDDLTSLPILLSKFFYISAAQTLNIKESEVFKLTPESKESLEREGLNDDLLTKLISLSNQAYPTEEEFMNALDVTIGKDLATRYKSTILRNIEKPGKFLDQFYYLKQRIIFSILGSIFHELDNISENSSRHNYRKLIDHWVKHRIMEEYLEWLDNPYQFYHQEKVLPIIQELQTNNPIPRERSSATIEELRKWYQQYPEITGPARYLAILLFRQEKFEEAVSILNDALEKAFSSKGREECQSLLEHFNLQIYIQKGNFKDALLGTKKAIEKEPENENLINQLTSIYDKWIEEKPEHAVELIQQIADDFNWWQKLINKRRKNITENMLEHKRQLMVKAAIIKQQIYNKDSNLMQTNEALDKVLELDKDNLQAIYFKMMNCWQLGACLFQDRIKDAKEHLIEADELADRILKDSVQAEYKEKANQIKQQMKQIQEKLRKI